jgi:hypothetical protein
MTRRRLDLFDLLPGVWDESTELHGVIWTQIRSVLADEQPLNQSERRVLLELLKRLERKREARRYLGFKLQRSRFSKRNAAIADDYVERIARNQARKMAQDAIRLKHKIGHKALQKITDSGRALGAARARLLARRLVECAARGESVTITNKKQLRALLAGDPLNNRK